MRQLLNVFLFEFNGYLKKKMYVGITLFFIAVIAVVLFFPRISDMLSGESQGDSGTGQDSPLISGKMLVGGNPEADAEGVADFLRGSFADSDISVSQLSEQELVDLVASGEASTALYLHSPLEYTYITGDMNMFDYTQSMLSEMLLGRYRMLSLTQAGVTPEVSQNILSARMTGHTITTGKDQMSAFFFVYVIVMMLYMSILLYGQFVATSVASEKGSRAMEMLITSSKPVNLMFGKVIGSGLAGLAQMALMLISALVFYRMNMEYWGDNEIIASIFNVSPELIFFALLFFISGFFIYAFVYGALASLVSRTEELDTTIAPVTFVLVAVFISIMTAMGSGNADSTMMVIFSYIPFTSPIAMFVRIAMSSVPPVEIFISVAILIASTIGVGYIASIIYRMGVLLYGKPPQAGEIIRMVRRAVKQR